MTSRDRIRVTRASVTKERLVCSQGMVEHGETIYGMSSTNNEYWKKADGTNSSDSSDESLSSCKEYRDASCNVDYDELEEIIAEKESVEAEDINESSCDSVNSRKLEAQTNFGGSKSSRYVRWDVLMSLGIGLWAVLCIVDVLHSDESVTRGWLYESLRGKKNASKIVSTKKQESLILWLLNSWPYLWKIISISSAGGAYVLLFLLLIVFCADPRLRKSASRRVAAKSCSNYKILPAKQVRDSIVENNNKHMRLCKKLPGIIEPKVVPVRVESSPAIYLHARILSTFEVLYCDEFTEFATKAPPRDFETETRKILHASSQTDGRNFQSINTSLVAQLDIAGYGPFKFTNRNFITEQQFVASIDQADSSERTFAVGTLHLKIEEYAFGDACASTRGIESTGKSAESSNNKKGMERIITSSPAFKKFLSSLRHSEVAPLAISATPHAFNLQDARL